MQRWIEDLEDNEWGYIRTKTPLMAKSDLYKISGHWDHYKDGMFVMGDEEKDKEVFALRPMTCPFQYYVYKASQHSYRDLPLRYGETSTLFRNEDSGEMHGLTRVRQFTISEGHLIVRPDQMVEEFKGCLALAKHCLQTLGVEEDVTYHLSKWDPDNREKYIGEPEVWEETQQHMRDIMEELQIPYVEDMGEAAFYGPKIDINARNVYGKEDTMITIQWDALLAEQFDMYFIDQNGDKVRPGLLWAAMSALWRGWWKNTRANFPHGCVLSRCAFCPSPKNMRDMPGPSRRSLRKTAYWPRWTPVRRRSVSRSGKPVWPRCPICWWWANRRRPVLWSPSEAASRVMRDRNPWLSSLNRSVRRFAPGPSGKRRPQKKKTVENLKNCIKYVFSDHTEERNIYVSAGSQDRTGRRQVGDCET